MARATKQAEFERGWDMAWQAGQQELERLRAENERLRADGCFSQKDEEALAIIHRAADLLRSEPDVHTEVNRLRAEIITWGQMWNDEALLTARAEALRDGTADLGRPRDG